MANVEIAWNLPPTGWSLNAKDTHVWAAALDTPPGQLPADETSLSLDELERARRFHFERDRRHFISGRARLRAILAAYLQSKPQELRFEYGPYGKPALVSALNHRRLHFNLAHSDGLLLVGVSQLGPLGVDVERIKPINNLEDLAHQFCSAPEAKELLSLPEAPRMAAFYHLWTRKEACVKATGDGLSGRLKEIKITFLPDEPARLLEFNASEYPSASWALMNLQPAAGYAAALAITAQPWNVYCWQWTG